MTAQLIHDMAPPANATRPRATREGRLATGFAPDLGASASAILGLQRMAGNAATTALLQRLERDPMDATAVLGVVGRGGGRPLEPDVRFDMEAMLGSDFSNVRIHTDADGSASAAAVQAKAYTVGAEVVFGAGAYVPSTPEGRHTIAHELAHVEQQREGPVAGTDVGGGVAVSHPDDRFEQAAEAKARRVLSEGSGGSEGSLAIHKRGGSDVAASAGPRRRSVQRKAGACGCDACTTNETDETPSGGVQPLVSSLQRVCDASDPTCTDDGGQQPAGAPTQDQAPADASAPGGDTPSPGGAGPTDAGAPDAGVPETADADAGAPVAGVPDATAPDTGAPSAAAPDSAVPDGGASDTGDPAANQIVSAHDSSQLVPVGGVTPGDTCGPGPGYYYNDAGQCVQMPDGPPQKSTPLTPGDTCGGSPGWWVNDAGKCVQMPGGPPQKSTPLTPGDTCGGSPGWWVNDAGKCVQMPGGPPQKSTPLTPGDTCGGSPGWWVNDAGKCVQMPGGPPQKSTPLTPGDTCGGSPGWWVNDAGKCVQMPGGPPQKNAS